MEEADASQRSESDPPTRPTPDGETSARGAGPVGPPARNAASSVPALHGERPLREGLFGLATSAVLRGLGASWRIRTIGPDPRGPEARDRSAHLAALFHESLLPCAYQFRDRGYGVAVSHSRDGDRIRATLLRLGYAEPARGSSSRGGSALLRRMVRRLEAGTTVAVLVDGPRGPARRAKGGIVSLARLAGRPIQPVAFAARPALRLRSWDASLVPLPFARVICAFGAPLAVPRDLDEAGEEALAETLAARLTDLHESAERALRG